MTHKLTLEIPDKVYVPIQTKAQRDGLTPEAVALEWLASASLAAATDPVEGFIGMIPGTVSDWADSHDKYIADGMK